MKTKHVFFSFCVLMTGGASAEQQPFDIHDGYVRYTNLAGGSCRVTGADPTTFQLVSGAYGKDRLNVFYACDRLEGADPTSFVAVGREAGRDSRSVFFRDKAWVDCDVQTFRSLAEDWYADKNTAYRAHTPVPGVDIASFKRLNTWFAKDARRVYFSGNVVPGADAPSFKLESCGLSEVSGEDKNRCYWFEHPVPCDCKPHSGSNFPRPATAIQRGTGLVIESSPLLIDLRGVPEHTGLKAALHGNSGGYWNVDVGPHNFELTCWNKGRKERTSAMVNVEAGGLYRFISHIENPCEVEITRPTMVQGRSEDPEIQIESSEDPTKRLPQVELNAGLHKITAVCRYVNRSEVKDVRTSITLVLNAGQIYQLIDPSGNSGKNCNVKVESRALE